MAKSSKTLSGPSLGRFFRRFYQAQSQLDKETAERLTRLSVQTFASIQLRRLPWAKLRANTADTKQTPERAASQPTAPQDGTSEPSPSKPAESQKFDPYSFGLVPIYQREGREGLIEKLSTVGRADHLRKMARAQQIVLPAALRTGDIDPVELREAITAAVEKRIANRRAAAG